MAEGLRSAATAVRAAVGVLCAVGVAAALVGCAASSSFHRDFEAERYDDAMEAFRADSSLRNDDEALYRAGLLYASPEVPFYDPARAIETLETLVDRHPGTDHRHEARHLLGLLEEIRSLGGQVAELRDQLEKLKAVDLEEAPPDSAGQDQDRR